MTAESTEPTPLRHRLRAARGEDSGVLPHLGSPGSRSADLHIAESPAVDLAPAERTRFATWQFMGTVGAILVAIGGLGAGALPTVGNPVHEWPVASLLVRMLSASTALALCGCGLMVTAWVLMARNVTGSLFSSASSRGQVHRVSVRQMALTICCWAIPLIFTAPLFTQDIYSYLAQGSIVAQGLDVYSAGPVDILGPSHELARSVPHIWSHSPSPYGPTALGIAALISTITNDSIFWAVLCHRLVNIASLALSAVALTHLARHGGVAPQAALWLALANPLTLLHLIGGIHNEAILIGLLTSGMALALQGISRLTTDPPRSRYPWVLLLAAVLLISLAGMVKVTAFPALGFIGVALIAQRGSRWRHWIIIPVVTLILTVIICVGVSLGSGIGLGWITSQGGAATIRSWMSLPTLLGLLGGVLGMVLQLGDHTTAMVGLTQAVGLLIAGLFMLRMLLAVGRGKLHMLGGYGLSMFLLVLCFPVVHPWYLLWAIVPLATWANRRLFRLPAVMYSALASLVVLPRGLALPPLTVVQSYTAAAVLYVLLISAGYFILYRGASRRVRFRRH